LGRQKAPPGLPSGFLLPSRMPAIGQKRTPFCTPPGRRA